MGPRNEVCDLTRLSGSTRSASSARPVEIDGHAVGEPAEFSHLHGRAYWDAQRVFGDAVAGQQVLLPVGGCPAVAAHGRNDKGVATGFCQDLDRRFGQLEQAGRTPAADADRDLGARCQRGAGLGTIQLPVDGCCQVGLTLAGETLPHSNPTRQ